jgi:hypothetical protein
MAIIVLIAFILLIFIIMIALILIVFLICFRFAMFLALQIICGRTHTLLLWPQSTTSAMDFILPCASNGWLTSKRPILQGAAHKAAIGPGELVVHDAELVGAGPA